MSHRALLRVRNLACSVLLTFLSALSGSAALGQSQARITHAIDDTSAVRISRTTHPLATPMNDRGRAASDLPMERMMLVLRPAEAQRAAAAKLIDGLHDKSSASYHRWLTPEEYGKQFGPDPSDVNQVSVWLQQHGFRVNSVARGRHWIEFSGTAGQVESVGSLFLNRSATPL